MVAAPAGADLVHAESHMNEEHEHDSYPVVKLGKYRGKCIQIAVHCPVSLFSIFVDWGHYFTLSKIFLPQDRHLASRKMLWAVGLPEFVFESGCEWGRSPSLRS
jgi:hypothetical protein